MKKICFIIPYFSEEFPSYFPYFLKTASWNGSIDFRIFSNAISPKNDFKNIKFINFTLQDFNHLAKEKLQLEIDLKKPYKLCDFKPVYGAIFEDYIKEYDFWGHCDIDLLFGNIRNFITDDLLNQYNVLSARKEYLSGFFTLYRNTTEFCNLYKKSEDYLQILLDKEERNFCFDEYGINTFVTSSGKRPRGGFMDEVLDLESMTEVVNKNKEFTKPYLSTNCHEFHTFDNKEQIEKLIGGEKGLFSLIDNQEFLLSHLINRKNRRVFNIETIEWSDEQIYLNRYSLANKYYDLNEIVEEKEKLLPIGFMLNKEYIITEDNFLVSIITNKKSKLVKTELMLKSFKNKFISVGEFHSELIKTLNGKTGREKSIIKEFNGINYLLEVEDTLEQILRFYDKGVLISQENIIV